MCNRCKSSGHVPAKLILFVKEGKLLSKCRRNRDQGGVFLSSIIKYSPRVVQVLTNLKGLSWPSALCYHHFPRNPVFGLIWWICILRENISGDLNLGVLTCWTTWTIRHTVALCDTPHFYVDDNFDIDFHLLSSWCKFWYHLMVSVVLYDELINIAYSVIIRKLAYCILPY